MLRDNELTFNKGCETATRDQFNFDIQSKNEQQFGLHDGKTERHWSNTCYIWGKCDQMH